MNKLLFFCILLIALPAYIHSQTEPVDTDSDGKKEVSTLSHLLWISTNSSGWSYSYEQTANIDASVTSGWDGGAGFSPIGISSPYFTGIYDGQGFTISNLTINRSGTYNIGMFGIVNGGTIKNLGLVSIYAYGRGTTGALVGYGSDMTVQNCYSTGLVRSEYDKAGGLIQTVLKSSHISPPPFAAAGFLVSQKQVVPTGQRIKHKHCHRSTAFPGCAHHTKLASGAALENHRSTAFPGCGPSHKIGVRNCTGKP